MKKKKKSKEKRRPKIEKKNGSTRSQNAECPPRRGLAAEKQNNKNRRKEKTIRKSLLRCTPTPLALLRKRHALRQQLHFNYTLSTCRSEAVKGSQRTDGAIKTAYSRFQHWSSAAGLQSP